MTNKTANIVAIGVLIAYLALVVAACTDAVEVPKPQPDPTCLKWEERQVGFKTVFVESEEGAEPIAVLEPITEKVCILEGTR